MKRYTLNSKDQEIVMAVPSADFGCRSNPGLEDRLTGLSYDGLLLFGRVLMALERLWQAS
jgi:hypothetical protein